MTDPQVTQADRERANAFILQDARCPHVRLVSPPHECAQCIALELAKVREDSRAEMQAACVAEAKYHGAHGTADGIKALPLDGTNALEDERVQDPANYTLAQEFVSRLCSDGIVAHPHSGEGDSSCPACDIRGRLVLELARVRQEEQAKVDEAVPAVVEKIRQGLVERGYEEDSHYIYTVFDEASNAQQTLAERDKRMRGDVFNEIRRACDATEIR